MTYLVSLITCVAVTLAIYGIMYRPLAGNSVEARLGGLRYTRAGKETIQDPNAAFSARVVKPLLQTLSGRVSGLLPSTLSSRVEGALVRGGIKIRPGTFISIIGVMVGVMPLAGIAYGIMLGMGTMLTLLFGLGGAAFAGYGPRIWVLGRIKRRQKEIWRSLPDAFDLITASVEAGLGVDASFTRVIEKVSGPLAEELTRTMREISMGRSRREAFLDMADRTGVDELRSLINAIVQAEQMGISIGTVIRVQTGVIRTKRRQRAEEQAFKAPIKMVFPLVFFIFPAIMVVIGGPAIIQMKDSF